MRKFSTRTGIRCIAVFGAFALLGSGLSACGGGPDDTTQASGSVVSNGRIDERLLGAWRVLGEGALLEVTRSGVTQFQQGETLCYLDEIASTDDPASLAGQSFKGSFGKDRATVDLFELAGAPSSSTLERIGSIPAACRARPPTDPATTFKAMCELMGLDYAFFAERKIDWAARCKGLAPSATAAANDDALQAVLIDALQGFNDAHVKLYRGHFDERQQVFSAGNSQTGRMLKQAFDGQTDIKDFRAFQIAWRDDVRARIEQRLSGGSGPVLNGAMRWGRLPGKVGYIGFYRMLAFSDDSTPAGDVRLVREEMDRAVAALADTKALIVDVSLNGGGLDAVSAEIAASFADQRRLAFTKHAHRPQGRPAQPWYVEPKGPLPYRKPVYVLTSDGTGSAAETFTLMMRQFPGVTHAGQATAGSISDVLEKPLPGNFSVSFSNEVDLDPAGVLFEVSGIPPRLPLPMFRPDALETLLTGHGEAISALINMATR